MLKCQQSQTISTFLSNATHTVDRASVQRKHIQFDEHWLHLHGQARMQMSCNSKHHRQQLLPATEGVVVSINGKAPPAIWTFESHDAKFHA
jgi:hypothetical protein